jgi:hypothetical protein
MNKLFLFFIVFCSFNCDEFKTKKQSDSQTIIEVIQDSYGGKVGFQSKLTVNNWSIDYFSKIVTRPNEAIAKQQKNTQASWQSLLQKIDLKEFKKVKEGRSNLPVDGLDTKITIKTSTGDFSVVNGKQNAWIKIDEKLDEIKQQLQQ